MNTFKFIGKIKKIEEKGDRKYIDTVITDKGWMIERVKFLITHDGNEQFIDASGGKFADDSKNIVYTTFAKESDDESKGYESVKVDWDQRFDPEIIEKVPKFRRYTIDLSSDRAREQLIEEGRGAEAAELLKQKYSFITQYDFTVKMAELLRLGAFKDDNYVITGNVEYSYSFSKKTNQWNYYRSFVPTAIRKAQYDEIPGMTGKLDFYYLPDDFTGPTTEDGVQTVNGFLKFYEKMTKKNYFVPAGLQIRSTNSPFLQIFDMNYYDNAEVLVVGVNVEFFRGAVKTAVKDVELSDKNKLLIQLGAITKEDIMAELAGGVYGEYADHVYMTGLTRAYMEGPQNAEIKASVLLEQPDGFKDTLGGKNSANDARIPEKTKITDLWGDDDEI